MAQTKNRTTPRRSFPRREERVMHFLTQEELQSIGFLPPSPREACHLWSTATLGERSLLHWHCTHPAPVFGARHPLWLGCHKGDNDAQVPSVRQWTEYSASVGAGAVGVVFLLRCGHASLGQLGRQ